MRIHDALAITNEFLPKQFEDIRRNINPDWILNALRATGTATIRRRRLPAEQVVWLVIGMALMRNRSIHEIVSKLNLALPGKTTAVVPSTVADARSRLGDEPMEWLFTTSANEWAHSSADAHRWRGLSVYGVDGSTLRVADSPENAKTFGYACNKYVQSNYPLVRLTTLMALRSHLLAKVAFGPFEKSEFFLASELWSSVPDNSLTIVDKNYFSALTLISLVGQGKNRHWLIPAKKDTRWKVIKKLGRTDVLVEMKVCKAAGRKNPTLPRTWQARAITFRRKGFRPTVLLTSMLDSKLFPATEIACLYYERWELELGYDEIKTELLDREEAIRSKKPRGVRQELWGIFLAFNLVRLEMEKVAEQADVEPTRISFVAALRLICDEWLWCAIASPGAIPRHLRKLRDSLTMFILPPRRTDRHYPRAVKLNVSSYKRKLHRSDPRIQNA